MGRDLWIDVPHTYIITYNVINKCLHKLKLVAEWNSAQVDSILHSTLNRYTVC